MKNKNNIAIYDLNNPFFLYEDVEAVLDDISNIYGAKFNSDKTDYISKIIIPQEIYWASEESNQIFNKSIPKIIVTVCR